MKKNTKNSMKKAIRELKKKNNMPCEFNFLKKIEHLPTAIALYPTPSSLSKKADFKHFITLLKKMHSLLRSLDSETRRLIDTMPEYLISSVGWKDIRRISLTLNRGCSHWKMDIWSTHVVQEGLEILQEACLFALKKNTDDIRLLKVQNILDHLLDKRDLKNEKPSFLCLLRDLPIATKILICKKNEQIRFFPKNAEKTDWSIFALEEVLAHLKLLCTFILKEWSDHRADSLNGRPHDSRARYLIQLLLFLYVEGTKKDPDCYWNGMLNEYSGSFYQFVLDIFGILRENLALSANFKEIIYSVNETSIGIYCRELVTDLKEQDTSIYTKKFQKVLRKTSLSS